MEEEILEISQANDVAQNLAADLADADRSLDVVQALEDLAFVADTIREATPREAALIQIIGDATVAGTGADADIVTPAMEDGEQKPNRIRETIRSFIEAIKKLLATVVQKIKKFVEHVFKVSANVKGRYDELKQALETAEFKDNGTINASFKVMPGYKYAEWDQLFKMIDEAAIEAYLAKVHTLDKAGGYGIQDSPELIVAGYQGSLTNIIGLPVETTKQILTRCGLLA